MEEKKKRVDLGLDNPVMLAAKQAMNAAMKIAVMRAIKTGSMEGTATLKVNFELEEDADRITGEEFYSPKINYKAAYSVPMKDSIDGSIAEACRIIQGTNESYLLVNNQISMNEIMEDLES